MTSKKRILFAIDSLVGGGAERVMSYLTNHLDKDKYEMTLYMSLGQQVDYEISDDVQIYHRLSDELREAASDIIIPENHPGFTSSSYKFNFLIKLLSTLVNMPYLFTFDRFSRRRAEFENFLRVFYNSSCMFSALNRMIKPDIVVSFLNNTNVITLFSYALFKMNAPIICCDHTALTPAMKTFPFPRASKYLAKWLYKKADSHVCVSDDAAPDLEKNYNVPKSRISRINNGIDLESVIAMGNEPLEDEHDGLFGDDDIFSIITMGRLAEQKAQDYLIRAFRKVRDTIDSKLFILGEGPDKEDLINLANKLGVARDVHFLGWQKNPFKYISRCDLFALSSIWEGHPMVLIEAMALGTPIVSTNCSAGVEEILGGGKYGKLTPIRDENALAKAIIEVAGNDQMRKELSSLCREGSRDFGVDKMLEQYEALFEKVLQ